jgi:hypothetical protein
MYGTRFFFFPFGPSVLIHPVDSASFNSSNTRCRDRLHSTPSRAADGVALSPEPSM